METGGTPAASICHRDTETQSLIGKNQLGAYVSLPFSITSYSKSVRKD